MAKRKSKSDSVKMSDPRTKLASTANTDKKKAKTHVAKTKYGKDYGVSSKSVNDAKAGNKDSAYKPSVKYKGTTIKNKDGKMTGYKTHDGSYTSANNPIDRKKAKAKIAYDKSLQAHEAKKRDKRNSSVANAKRKGTN
tara:strand:+ start:26553 stop:26966 length:414 start_codon:yes stop_codon:yes gene_type:complete